jgi:hypothetical protein
VIPSGSAAQEARILGADPGYAFDPLRRSILEGIVGKVSDSKTLQLRVFSMEMI